MEEIEISSHFLCPISLQLMTDPVTISTGITYDRQSIETWFFQYNNSTCPVTKQSIITDHDHDHIIITPNHTLHRLIQSSNGIERLSTPKQSTTVDRAYITDLISHAKQSPELRYSCLQRIRSLLTSSDTRIKKLLEASGTFQYVTSIIVTENNNPDSTKEEALYILAQLDSPESELKTLINDPFIDTIVGFLGSGSATAREQAVKLLKSIYSVADPNQLLNATCEFYYQIINIVVIGDHNQVSNQATKNALKLLMELNPWGRNRVKAVEAGAVWALVGLLMDGSDHRACELALVVLDQLCGCAEGRADLVRHGAGLAVVSKKILRVSHVASYRAVRILSSISRCLGTEKVVGEMVEVGVVAKLCLVVQMDHCSGKTKEKAKEILKLHSWAWKMSPCIPPHLLSSYTN